jgi:hypothetical protein
MFVQLTLLFFSSCFQIATLKIITNRTDTVHMIADTSVIRRRNVVPVVSLSFYPFNLGPNFYTHALTP